MSETTAPAKRRYPCYTAFRRVFGIAPVLSLGLTAALVFSTWYYGWVHPVGIRNHGPVELAFFGLEIFLLVFSYLTAVIRGPGFVPDGWKPSDSEIAERLALQAPELPLKVKAPPLHDLLQFCVRCDAHKPPRAHHCSTCGRCVLWMDHHCPWTNTCVGHQNFKAFVQFVHFVPLACLHSIIIHSEILVKLSFVWMEHDARRFWALLFRLRTILNLLSWIVALIVMLLVGSLAFEMQYTISTNMSMIEDYIVEKADSRRKVAGERKFVFPYDVGKAMNWHLLLGRRRLWRLIPGGSTPCEAVWPDTKSGCGDFDLSTEQIAQKAQTAQRSMVVPVLESFAAKGWCWLSYWCGVACRFGCCMVCGCQTCGETRLSVSPGDHMLVSRTEGDWVQGRTLRIDSDQRPDLGTPEGAFGWLPRACLDEQKSKRYQVPFQELLQGTWATAPGGPLAIVKGIVVRCASSRIPFVLRLAEGSTELLGCRLLKCDMSAAEWSNGDVWKRAAARHLPGGPADGNSSSNSGGVDATENSQAADEADKEEARQAQEQLPPLSKKIA